jgi:hypothetical protein
VQKKLKDQGLVVITVDLDDPNEKEFTDAAFAWLKQEKITLPNFLLDEKEEVWQEKLKVNLVPCLYVFNRAGQIEEKYTKKADEKELDALIDKLLKEKAP